MNHLKKKTTRTLSNSEYDSLKEIENLLDKTKSEYKSNKIQTISNSKENESTNPFDSVQMTDHAYKRAAERFNMTNRKQALHYFRGTLKEATFAGVTIDEERGNISHLYIKGKTNIYLSPDHSIIFTVYNDEEPVVIADELKDMLFELHRKKVNNYTRKEKSLRKKVELLTLESEIELAELKLRIHKTKSFPVKMACESRIKAIHKSLAEYKNDLVDIRSSRRKMIRSMRMICKEVK